MQISIIEDDTTASHPHPHPQPHIHPHPHHHLIVMMLLRCCKHDNRSVNVMVPVRRFDLRFDISKLQKSTEIPTLFTIKWI